MVLFKIQFSIEVPLIIDDFKWNSHWIFIGQKHFSIRQVLKLGMLRFKVAISPKCKIFDNEENAQRIGFLVLDIKSKIFVVAFFYDRKAVMNQQRFFPFWMA